MRWITLMFWLFICFTVAGTSAWWTGSEVRCWYSTLARPSFAPPNWVFGPVWTLLYALMAIAAWKAGLAASSPWKSVAITLFVSQLALNFTWSLVFFRWHQIGWALVDVIFLWTAILLTTLAFARVSMIASWLMTPYLAWVGFASILNEEYLRLNR